MSHSSSSSFFFPVKSCKYSDLNPNAVLSVLIKSEIQNLSAKQYFTLCSFYRCTITSMDIQEEKPTRPDPPSGAIHLSAVCNNSGDLQKLDRISSSIGISSNSTVSGCSYAHEHDEDGYSGQKDKRVRSGRNHRTSSTMVSTSISYSSYRLRSCDVFIGLQGRKPPLLRFANWLRAELEIQGISCFVSDRSRCRNSRKHVIVEKAMNAASFGIVIITRKCFKNPYTIEELQFFSGKKNLVPIYFDLSPADCLVRDIIEKRGEMWEKHGGELWVSYGGLEQEWKDAVHGLTRVDEWKLEAQDGNWRDCIFRAVTLLAMRLGRRSVAEHLTKWREKVEKQEFPFTRNENFIGRKKELSQLEFILFGDVTGDSERDYIELKARPKRKNFTIGWGKSNNALDERWRERHMRNVSRKEKEPVVWKESEKEIEMQNTEFPMKHYSSRLRRGGKYSRRKRGMKILYGKGIACVSGDSGIGKTELILEFAYRYQQRYKMVLWIGGESRYIRQNYLNLRSILEVDVGVENSLEKGKIKSFEEQEEAAISRIRRQLMRNIPYLVVIDNLESEKDWWDHKLVMDLLPRFGGETHVIISTRLSRVMNLEPLKLSYLSGVEAMSLMLGNGKDYPVTEMDALRIIEEKVGRLTLGLAIVSAILSELPITPSRLLETINRMPLKDISWSGKETHSLRQNPFLVQLFEVCFSIFDHADGPKNLTTRMVLASGWFAPSAIPVSLLALAAHKIPEKHQRACFWRKLLLSITCGLTSSYTKKSELEASSLLLRFNIARSSTKQDHIQFNELIKVYARKRCMTGATQAVVQAIISEGSISPSPDHLWAACFLLFGFGHDPVVVELKVSELLYMVKKVVVPLAIHTFITFSRCSAALELLRLCTDVLEAADQAFVTPVEKWLDKSLCWRTIQTNAQLNPCLWQELALCRATVLETRAKLMLRGAQFDIGDDLIRKAVFIRTTICGEDHPDTISARETLTKLTRLIANVQIHAAS
ncbi:P-loop containing nucleoside triphosphate hydrolase [Senna tora]|uniref:P-loop containing nucleoside triphosphate hydrolase n=1 Tax=Senna tora TaxID=362788 RepID=A0A834TWX3_9FABA|nr:P-loop containing nucleoside triphosphate hydrolase [Senna tora]